VSFYIAGDGADKNDFMLLNNELNAKIKFVGIISKTQKFLSSSHILVNPTNSKKEGFPTIIIEAGLQRNLIISSKFRGSQSILKDNINSILFEPGDIKSLMEVLLNSIDNYGNYNDCINEFYSTCKSYYNLEDMVKKIEELYQKD